MAVETKEQLDEILRDWKMRTFTVSEVKKGERSKAPLPFTTSTPAAGSIEGAELLHAEDDASGAACSTRRWK